mmetsp:Transcript_5527/g.12544  ORF Transcript_5527/g.12544 Transcript_5527/m.12544 type:complete len:261 (+) Transcript_5527:97-879(+)
MAGSGPDGASAAGADVDVHLDIARDIGQQVEIMILEAKHQSESKVGKEIQKVKAKMEAMGEKIKHISERVARMEPGTRGLLKSDLQRSIAKLEEVWEGEVGTLKHELWQTIQAHNHNADLLKHHKDAIDHVQGRMTEVTPNPELEQVHAQLMQVDKVMQRELAKEQQMDQLMSRLTVVQQQLSAGIGHWASGGMAAPPFPMAQTASPTSVSTAPGKKAKRQTTKPTKPKASAVSMQAAAAAASLRAEAPEFVPGTGRPDS